ncbi:phage major capsid protein [Enterobacter wuhouensis]|uniref:phage major capsid protein n=1 Tax=Enterobacter wuhouensis TaxID=2529381 RepID=UPI00352418E5
MKKLIELRRKKTELAAQLRTILEKADAENRSLNTEERTQFDDLKNQAEELRADIERYETLLEEERSAAGKGGKSQRSEGPTNQELRSYIMTGDTRSMSTTVPADGGYTIIPELDTQVMRILHNHRWQVYRAQYLRANPLCVICLREGKLTPATVVDHITPIRGQSDPLFWKTTNHQPLCQDCHNWKTRVIDRRGYGAKA